MMNKSVLIAISLLAWDLEMWAVPPSPVPQPKDGTHWTVTLRYDSASSTATPAAADKSLPTEIDITKLNKLTRARVSYKDGTKTEFWSIGNRVLAPTADHKFLPMPYDPDAPLYPYASPGFYGMRRVKEADAQGEVSIEGVKCIHYKGAAPDVAGSTYEAWIDKETKLPVVYREANVTFLYKFSAPEESTFALPPEQAAAWQVYVKNCEKMGLKP